MLGISVIVPVYNVENYLHQCLDSILAQTFADFELILVDDGSSDNCGVICDEYAEKDSRVHVIHQENQGVSIARNHGMQIAKGEYITFIDSDDWIDHRFLECLYASAKEKNADVCVSGVDIVVCEEEAKPIVAKKYKVFSAREAIEYFGQQDGAAGFRGPCAKLIKTTILKECLFPEDRYYGEDFAVVYKWYATSSVVIERKDQLYFYRKNENSATNRPYDLRRLGNLDTYEEILCFFQQNEYYTLYKSYLLKYASDVAYNYKQILDIEMPYVEKDRLLSSLRKKLRRVIMNKEKAVPLAKKNLWIYEAAFPKALRVYWLLIAIVNKLKRV